MRWQKFAKVIDFASFGAAVAAVLGCKLAKNVWRNSLPTIIGSVTSLSSY